MLHPFHSDISSIPLPARFTYPFCYTPHPLCVRAAEEVQQYLAQHPEWGEGKMFGVLVVQTTEGQLGYLAAFSGILAGENKIPFFVPPVYDLLQPDGFFKQEEAEISAMNVRITQLEQDPNYLQQKETFRQAEAEAQVALDNARQALKTAKAQREERRRTSTLTPEEADALIRESQFQKAEYKRLEQRWKEQLDTLRWHMEAHEAKVQALKHERKTRSADLQLRLFRQFRMLNYRGEVKDLCELFADTVQRIPPAGAGECAAPKLLQYAYLHGWKPLVMAEFWWGKPSQTEVRRQGHYYPSCTGKCGPILRHMLQGLDVEENPLARKNDKEKELEEVVVTGYQKIDRKLFTGAAARISGEEAKVDGVGDVSQMLQGKAAGVGVQSVSGTFGAAPKIRVRGASSIYGNQTPLWVVDGVVLEDVVEVSADDLSSGNAATLISSAVAGLNPDDIDNFQILKDASATALYGARAMNGVIVVNTKRGRKGHASISYTGEFTVRTRPSYRQYNIMNSKDQMSVLMELEDKGWFNHAQMARTENGGVFYLMNDLIYRGELMNTESARLAYLQKAEMRNTNWFKELFRPTIQSNNSVSISSGTDRSSFYASMSFLDDPGWSVSDKVRRYTANVNASYDISKWLTLGVGVNGSVRNQRAPGTLDRTADPVSGEYSRDFDINPFSYALNTSRTMSPDDTYIMNYAPFNILNEARNNYIDLDMTDMKFQLELTYKPVKGLDLSAIGAFRYVKSTQENKVTGESNLAQAYRAAGDATIREKNKFLYRDPDNPDAVPEVVMPKGGFYNTTDNILKSYYFRASANYNRLIAQTHPFNVLVGMEVKSADRQSGFNNGYGFQWDRGGTPFVDYRIIQQLLLGGDNYYGLSQYYDRFVAFFATGSFSYKGRYTFNLTGRMDGSNRLGRSRDARWLPTWNVSGAWNVLEEEWMKSQNVVSTLSLRATYGRRTMPWPCSATPRPTVATTDTRSRKSTSSRSRTRT